MQIRENPPESLLAAQAFGVLRHVDLGSTAGVHGSQTWSRADARALVWATSWQNVRMFDESGPYETYYINLHHITKHTSTGPVLDRVETHWDYVDWPKERWLLSLAHFRALRPGLRCGKIETYRNTSKHVKKHFRSERLRKFSVSNMFCDVLSGFAVQI